jgi:hypothetical protein
VSKDKSPTLIQCADHSWAPYVMTCAHLMEGSPPEKYHRIDLAEDDLREIEADFICTDCFEKHGCDYHDDLRVVCIHCFRHMQQRDGVK